MDFGGWRARGLQNRLSLLFKPDSSPSHPLINGIRGCLHIRLSGRFGEGSRLGPDHSRITHSRHQTVLSGHGSIHEDVPFHLHPGPSPPPPAARKIARLRSMWGSAPTIPVVPNLGVVKGGCSTMTRAEFELPEPTEKGNGNR